MIGTRNLAPERGPNVWDSEEYSAPPSSQSRWRSGLGGVAVAAAGAALAAVGGQMVYRALSGRAAAVPPQHDEDLAGRADEVGQQSSESFPASDSPSWTPVRTVSPRTRKPEVREDLP